MPGARSSRVGFVVSRMVPSFRRDAGAHRRGQPGAARADHRHPRRPRVRPRAPRDRALRHGERRPHRRSPSRAGRWMATHVPARSCWSSTSPASAVLWFGGHRVDSGQMQIGALTAFLCYLMQILMSVMMATFMLMMVPRAAVCADRIAEVLDTDTSVVPPPEPRHPSRRRAARSTSTHVDVLLPGRRRAGACATCRSRRGPGQTVAVIGSTGAGKSTLVNLVPRLFDATGGRGAGRRRRRPRPRPRPALGPRSGWCRRRPTCSPARSRTNLQHGKADATDDEMWAALEIAQARDFVEAHARGARRAGRRRAAPTSRGGQRQRLAIARALVTPTRRSTCSTTRSRRSTSPPTPGCGRRSSPRPATRRCSSSRSGSRTIRDADLILVLEDGGIVGRGTHDELLATARRTRRSSSPSSARRRRHEHDTQPEGQEAQGDRAGRGARRAARAAARSAAAWSGRRRSTFGPSAKRLLPGCVRSAARRSRVVVLGGRAACSLMSLGPTDPRPRHRPDLRRAASAADCPPRRPRPGGRELRARATARSRPGASMDVVPGQGVDFGAVGQVLLLVLGVYVGASLLVLAAGLPAQRRRAGHRAPDARRRRGQDQPAAAELLRPAAPRRAAQPRHQRHRQRQPDAAADDEPAADLAAHGRRRARDDVLDLAAARAGRAGDGAALDGASPRRS